MLDCGLSVPIGAQKEEVVLGQRDVMDRFYQMTLVMELGFQPILTLPKNDPKDLERIQGELSH